MYSSQKDQNCQLCMAHRTTCPSRSGSGSGSETDTDLIDVKAISVDLFQAVLDQNSGDIQMSEAQISNVSSYGCKAFPYIAAVRTYLKVNVSLKRIDKISLRLGR